MRTMRAYKFVVMPVLQVVDDDGTVIREQSPAAPDTLYGVDQLARYAAGFEDALERHLGAAANGHGDLADVVAARAPEPELEPELEERPDA